MQETESESHPTPWVMAARFEDQREVLRTYERLRDSLLTKDVDASVFRLTFQGASYVAVVSAESTPTEWRQSVLDCLSEAGTHEELPQQVMEHLLERRRSFKSTGLEFFERRSSAQ